MSLKGKMPAAHSPPWHIIPPSLVCKRSFIGAVEKAFVKGATPLSPLVRGVKAMPPDEGVEEKPP